MLHALQLPNLRRLMLANCPKITSETICQFLLVSNGIEQLYLHLKALKIAELLHLLKDYGGLRRLSRLREVSLPYEPSLAYWLHVQELLTYSPIQIFHIIKSTIIPISTVVPFPLAQHEPARHRYRGDILSHVTPPPPLSRAARRARYPLHLRAQDFLTGSQLRVFGDNTSTKLPFCVDIDDAFVERFVQIHGETLRIFWIAGMEISESSLSVLRSGCPNISRIRANDLDEEFRVR